MAGAKSVRPSAAERTISMFAAAPAVEAPVEAEEPTVHAAKEETPLEEADRHREQALKFEEWATKHFGLPDEGASFRLSSRKGTNGWYLERVFRDNGKTCASYTGLMLLDSEIEPLTRMLVEVMRNRRSNGNQS